jgi:hypothetical protein
MDFRSRSVTIGYANPGSICGPSRYSINEFIGLSGNIYNAAHDLWHG